MSFKKSLILFFLFMCAGITAYALIAKGVYPAVIVNSDLITAATVEKDYGAAFRYYYSALLTYDKNRVKALDDKAARQEIKRAVLDRLIEDSLIYKEARNRFGGTLDAVTANTVSKNAGVANLKEAAEKLYGLTLEEFQDRILGTQARKELLEGRMFADKENFDGWLEDQKKNAKVFILTPGFAWDGKSVIISE